MLPESVRIKYLLIEAVSAQPYNGVQKLVQQWRKTYSFSEHYRTDWHWYVLCIGANYSYTRMMAAKGNATIDRRGCFEYIVGAPKQESLM